ncbi:MAG: hypothetical protein ACXVED_18455, partial [Bacteroidia bacterium]
LDQKDGICIKTGDGVCDPDCSPGADPDCATTSTVVSVNESMGEEIINKENNIAEKNIVENFQSSPKDSVIISSSSQESAIAQVKEKIKKPRYVQMDFSTQGDEKHSGDIQRTTTQLFRIKINSEDETNVVSNSENKFPIKLRHNF